MGLGSKDIDKKIKNLRCYKVYDYSSISNSLDEDRSLISVKMKRKEKKNEIVKIGKAKFYKRRKNAPVKNEIMRFNSPSDRAALRYKSVKPSKYPIFLELFWSNRNIPIPLDRYISRVLSEDSISYLPQLRHFFGDRKVIEVYLNNFYPNDRKKHVEEFFNV